MLYHAFEIATDGSYYLHVDRDETAFNDRLQADKEGITAFGEEIETVAIGTVEAESIEAALNKIRAGDWQYSQKN